MSRRDTTSIGLLLVFVVWSSVLVWSSANNASDVELKGLQTVRVALQWHHQAQFAGFYVAKEKGYYQEVGLDVDLQQGGKQVVPYDRVQEGSVEIGLFPADQLLLRSTGPGGSMKVFGTVFGKSVACFISRDSMGVRGPQDFIGKRVAVYQGKSTDLLMAALLKKHDVDVSGLSGGAVLQGGNWKAFVAGAVDVYPGNTFNEPLKAKMEGLSVGVITGEKYGVRGYSDSLFCRSTYWQENRDVLERFVSATRRGWKDAMRDPDLAIEAMYSQTRLKRNPPHERYQREMLKLVVDAVNAGNRDEILGMEVSQWRAMEEWLVEIGKIDTRGHVRSLCDFEISGR